MRKWVKRCMLGLALLLALVALLSGVGFTMLRSAPEWYLPRGKVATTQSQRLARAAENKLIEAQNWAAELRADAVRLARAAESGTAKPATRAADSHLVEFTQDEINALFDKWSVLYGWGEHYGEYVEDPAIVLRDGSLILAGKVAAMNAVVSATFRPSLTAEGKLRMEIVRVAAGRLPLPERAWTSYRFSAERAIWREMPKWRQGAKISPNGAANSAAMSAAMGMLGVHAMRQQPAEAVLFLPLAEGGESVPVRLTDVAIDDGKLSMQVVPMTADERAALLTRIRSGSQ